MDSSSKKHGPLKRVRRVVIVSNVLPVEMTRNEDGQWEIEFDQTSTFEEGMLYTALANSIPNSVFVGVPPVNVKDSERDQVEALLLQKRCYPVYCGTKEASYHFQGVCKSVLWPLFHNVIDLYNEVAISGVEDGGNANPSRPSTPRNEGEWDAARSFNPQEIEVLWPYHLELMMKFRNVIKSLYSEGDMIWIHDYSLAMLVGTLRRQLPLNAPIGIFFHVPFPSSDIFRCLSKRVDYLKSVLSANHVGFHSFDYSRSFLTCCQRILGCVYGAQPNGVFGIRTEKGRTVTLTASHCGIDSKLVRQVYEEQLPLPSAFPELARKDTLVICSVDEVEGLRGLQLKLLAFDRLLQLVPKFQNQRVVLNQVGLQLNARPHDFDKALGEITRLVTQINTKYGAGTVNFVLVPSFSLAQRLQLYSDSDVLLVTCVKWGLSVDGFEWSEAMRVRAQQAAEACSARNVKLPRGPGVIIISEFVSSCRVLSGAIRVNPWSIEDVAKAMEEACKMPLEEKLARCFRDLNMIDKHPISRWVHTVLTDFATCAFDAKLQNSNLMSYGFGIGMRSTGGMNDMRPLDVASFCSRFAAAKRTRVLVFDYSDTLVETTPVAVYLKTGGKARSWHYTQGDERAIESRNNGGCLETRDPLSDTVVKSLRKLTADPRNRVVVVSQDLRIEVLHALQDVPNVIIVAEEGYVTLINGEWRRLIAASEEYEGVETWQHQVKQVIDTYVERTTGSFCFTAPSSVSFNYMMSDPELGEHQSKSLSLQLESVIAALPLVLQFGKGSLTVRRKEVNRGAVLAPLLSLLPERCDFLACFGDDVEDESMFQACLESKVNDVFTCRIGLRAETTKANYVMHDAGDVSDLLEKLSDSEFMQSNLASSGNSGGGGGFGAAKRPSSFAMLPGGFVTKQSLVNLSALAGGNEDEEFTVQQPQEQQPRVKLQAMGERKKSLLDTMNELDALHGEDNAHLTPPSPVRAEEGLFPPAPFSIPQTSNDAMLPSPPSAIPPTAGTAARSGTGSSNRGSKERSPPVSVLRNSSGRRIGGQDRSAPSPPLEPQQQPKQPQSQNAANTIIAAAVGGAVIASLAILVADRLRRA